VSAREAAALLGLTSPFVIYRLRYAGKLTAYTPPGVSTLRFKRSDVEALMQPAPYAYTPRPRRPVAARA
jgi:excisionase family DNA binding protein